jgi:DMSO/TMAO reductase YedYZ heme-binding membrane subunit
MNPKIWWYLARGAGMTSWALAAVTLICGLLLSTRFFTKWPRPAWTLDIHRTLGGLTVAFVGVHMVGLFADGYVHFGPAQLFIPLASTWRPGAVAWGIVALYLLIAVEVTSLLRRHMRASWWRRLHVASVAVFPLGTIHALTAGTDAGPLFGKVVVGVTALVVFLWALRLIAPRWSAGRAQAPPPPSQLRNAPPVKVPQG